MDDIDPHNVRVKTRINGKEVQNESTSYLIFNIPTLISYCSKFVTLEPGDMKDGDVCEIEIDGIGVLRNPIKLEK